MARPGFVHEVDERTPPMVVPNGERFRLQRFPLGTRVIYPADSLPALPDVREAIDAALDAPLDSAPLAQRLSAGMRLTLVLDDLTVPSPSLAPPDVRGLMAEAVLTRAAAAGVDDVAVVIGRGLNRRLSENELRRLTGERVHRSFAPEGLLTQHDAEDANELTEVGGVTVATRVAESDLVVHLHVVDDPAETAGAALLAGVGGPGNPAGATFPLDPPVFEVGVVLDNDPFPRGLEFLTKREWEWKLPERAAWFGAHAVAGRGLDLLPKSLRKRIPTSGEATYAPTLLVAGDPAAVTAAATAQLRTQRRVEVQGQVDVGVVGVGALTPYSHGSVTNPVLAAWQALVGLFGSHTGTPFVRQGGALIVYHPMAADFSPLHHPSYVDFFSDVLPGTGETGRVAADIETKYRTDPWYTHLYRTGHAFHGVHPLQRWDELSAAAQQLGDVVFVGADRASVERLGFRAASTLADALEIVAATVGRTPSISYLHAPPHILVDVV